MKSIRCSLGWHTYIPVVNVDTWKVVGAACERCQREKKRVRFKRVRILKPGASVKGIPGGKYLFTSRKGAVVKIGEEKSIRH